MASFLWYIYSSTHVQDHQLDLRCLNIHLAHALLYAHRLRGLKKLPARRRGARLSVSPLDDKNEVMRTVRGRGRPKNTLAFSQSVCYWNSSACVAQLNVIDIQTIFIKMWMYFLKLYGYSF